MGTVRHVVLPVLRLLVWTVIAAALCYLAFGRGSAVASPDLVEPGVDTVAATVVAELGDLQSTVDVAGTVSADPAAVVRSTAAGTVSRLRVAVGDRVEVGAPLLDVRVTLEPVEAATVTAPDGTVTTAPSQVRTRTVTVAAATAGSVASLGVLVDQEVAVGADVASVSPGTLSVTAPLTQSQQFRLLTPPAAATAQAPGGPAPFSCEGLSTAAAAAAVAQQPTQPDPFTGQLPETSTAQVSCRVPAGTTVFPGMSVDLSIDTGSVQQVVVLPLTAVLGTVGSGTVSVVGADGVPAERAVQLGISDAERVEVTGGLQAGEQVLEFAPVGPSGPVDVLGGAGG